MAVTWVVPKRECGHQYGAADEAGYSSERGSGHQIQENQVLSLLLFLLIWSRLSLASGDVEHQCPLRYLVGKIGVLHTVMVQFGIDASSLARSEPHLPSLQPPWHLAEALFLASFLLYLGLTSLGNLIGILDSTEGWGEGECEDWDGVFAYGEPER
ncbi:uncharacterized protein EI90DRAFT_3013773 [Cantharellus anzutake]|uniref:uncharacterized protein n=1 Tax=Cantharellus anzutake TaxID=1750568 RepID=UPI001906F4E0|nr:uncharacterized protein EI90DRAFT_3013773 [Cantharellus anzutake]KAF8337589.1 hypothetical protein EI90DRAFT_3013773 [Cantharellus anzutake]